MHQKRTWGVVGGALLFICAMAVLIGTGSAAAKNPPGKPLPPAQPRTPLTQQVIAGFPLTITVQDDTRMEIDYRDAGSYQFYGNNAEGAYLWVNIGGETKVFGPSGVPAGRATNTYTAVSNTFSGAGTPSNPWLVTTVNNVPGTPLRLTQKVSYVNGAEFTGLSFQLQQISGSTPITATLFHAADLYTNGSDSGIGYYDSSTHGIGDYYTATNGIVLYQEFVPNTNTPPSAYMEGYYGGVWDAIGTTDGPGTGFDNSVVTDSEHDSGAGLQWNLTIPAGGSVTVGDTDLFSPHASLCGSFSDVPYGSFNYDYIYYLACNGIVSGYSDTTFRPNSPTTRGQLAKIAANSAAFTETVSGQIFTDVPPTNNFYPFIQRLATRSLISGYTCGSTPSEPCDGQSRPYFRPSVPVSRAQIAKILANVKGLNGTPTGQTFADVPQTNTTYWAVVERLAALGTISGYTCGGTNPDTGAAETCDAQSRPYFRLNSNATRGQIAKIDKLTFFPALRQP